MILGALLLTGLVYLVIYRSRFGLAVRAVIGSPVAARLVGINVPATASGAFALASAVGGVAGYLVLATNQQVTAMFGMWTTMKGLIAMMIGGLGSVPGAIVGGLVLGVVEAHSQWYAGPQLRDLAAYLLLFAVLVLRPGGLLGETPVREAATVRHPR
jgi:branched-chain amino acid transport system permease protein